MKQLAKILLSLLILSTVVLGQRAQERLKIQALQHIRYEKYGEAIDLLNKYISANARSAEGYNIRGFCFEKREVYKYAVLDFRRAVRLEPDNQEYRRNLERTLRIWHQQLYERIDGYKREIAINPDNPFNYLEVGKAYRWLEIWAEAETWYDRYIIRDDLATPDEILRYTEILAKTGSIKKGEKILKKYVDRFPEDWRLWSRYGYFTMWLGNYTTAKTAFKNSLGFKPYFKEAQDGLDQAERKAYLIKSTPRAFERVYPIDQFYGLLKKNPDDDATRFKLVDELVKEDRIEEAFQQLLILQNEYADSANYISLYDYVETIRDSTYQIQIELYKNLVENFPQDEKATIKLADYYAKLFFYDEAIETLQNYVDNYANDEAEIARYQLAQYCAWNFEWERAIEQLDFLLEMYPENIDYQLLRGQISVWTVLELDKAETLLLNILSKEPENLNAIISLASLYSWEKDFDRASEYLDLAKRLAPGSQEVETAESNYEIHLSAFNEMEILKIRGDAGQLALDGDCLGALDTYDEYFSQITGPSRDELLEYADISICAEDFERALDVYNQILDVEYDSDIALRRARVYFWQQDTSNAITEFERLADEIIDNYEVKLFLGHSYLLNKEYEKANTAYEDLLSGIDDPEVEEIATQSKFNAKLSIADSYIQIQEYAMAENVLEEMLEEAVDSTQAGIVQERINWIPPYGVSAAIGAAILPEYIGLVPLTSYYGDNQGLDFYSFGARMFFGSGTTFSLGALWQRTRINSDKPLAGAAFRDLTQFKGILNINLSERLSFAGSVGQVKTLNEDSKLTYDALLSYIRPDRYSMSFYYQKIDARLLLFSPFLLHKEFEVDYFKLSGSLYYKKLLVLSAYYDYLIISDGNRGNNLNIRLGRKFTEELLVGYEYHFADYGRPDLNYYAPQNLETHSIWGEWDIIQEEDYTLQIGGKAGYAPAVDFIINEAYGDFKYALMENLSFNLRATLGESYRYDAGYSYFSAQASLFMTF